MIAAWAWERHGRETVRCARDAPCLSLPRGPEYRARAVLPFILDPAAQLFGYRWPPAVRRGQKQPNPHVVATNHNATRTPRLTAGTTRVLRIRRRGRGPRRGAATYGPRPRRP